jgi:NADPH:quinone reductase-like Zn-dependent oxidoreductase
VKAIVQERYGSPDGLRVREINKPVVGDDRVLVRVRAASVNAADWHLMQRFPHIVARLLRQRPSQVRGSDLAGQVEAVGKNVTRFKAGDEVFGSGRGSFAEYATASEETLAPKPQGLRFEEAAAISGAGCTALQGLRDKAHVTVGQRALIYGAGGGVGTFAVQIAKALGAHVSAVTTTMNLDLLGSIGADVVIDYTAEDFTKRGQRYDVVFDIGADRSDAEYQRVLEPHGTLLLVGAPKGLPAILWRVFRARSSRQQNRRISYIARITYEDLVALKNLVEAGKLSPVIDRQYALSEVPDAIRYIGTRRARGKVVITIP